MERDVGPLLRCVRMVPCRKLLVGQGPTLRVCVGALLLAALCLPAWGARKVAGVKPTFVAETGELRLLPDAAFRPGAWRMNNWKKVQKAEVSYPAEKTPTGAPCVRIAFLTKGGGHNIISPPLQQKGAWRQRRYGAISFWVKGDAGGLRIRFGASTKGVSYSWSVRLDSAKWRKVVLPIASAFTRKGRRRDLNDVSLLVFSSGEPATFLVGDFRMDAVAQEMLTETAPAVVVPLVPGAAVKLDGVLDEPAWAKAHKVKLIATGTGKPPKERTEVALFSDGKTLYVGARMADADTSKLFARQTMRDSQVWQDDCIEVFLDDNLDAYTYKHFILNSVGAVQDYTKRFDKVADTVIVDKKWDPKWAFANKVEPKVWTAEMAIPLDVIGVRPGAPFGLQIGRENHSGREYSALTRTRRFTNVRNFAIALIGRGAPLKGFSLASRSPGDMVLKAVAPRPGPAKLELFIADPYGKLDRRSISVTADKAGQLQAPLKLATPLEGAYRVVVGGRLGGDPLAPLGVSFSLVLPPEVNYGDIFLNPRPKQMTRLRSRFEFDAATPIVTPKNRTSRTARTARFLRDDVYDLMGLLMPIGRSGEGKAIRMALRGDGDFLSKADRAAAARLPAEGYLLKVDSEGVQLVGADEAGLYYGAVTFLQLFRAGLVKKQEPAVPGARIVDWPDRPMRFVVHWIRARYRSKEPRNDLKTLKNYVKRYVAGNKLNFWSPMMDSSFEYDRETRITVPGRFLKREDYEELARFAREHFITVVPALQSGGHSGHIYRAHRDLKEPGYDKDQMNVLNPKFYDVLFSCYEDILDANPGAKYFHIWHDEWWHHPTAAIKETFQGKPRWKIFRDDILKNHAFFKKRGIRMIMCCDMLLREHNGGYPFFVSKGLKDLPRDIVMHNWSMGSAPNGARELRAMGFTVLDICNAFRLTPPKDVPVVSGTGTVQYSHYMQTFWYGRDATIPRYVHAPFRAGDHAWNLERDCRLPLGEWRRRYLNTVNAYYNFSARRATGLRFKPVDLKASANVRSAEWFGEPKLAPEVARGTSTFGFIPFRVADAKAADVVAATPEKPEVAVPLGGRALKCLFFLQGTYLPGKDRAAFKKRSAQYLHGVPIGEIRIEYTDGPTQTVELRMGINTLETTPLPAARVMYGTRYTHDIRTPSGKQASLYVVEWSNPWRYRRVRRVVWKRYETEATPVLFGLTVGY